MTQGRRGRKGGDAGLTGALVAGLGVAITAAVLLITQPFAAPGERLSVHADQDDGIGRNHIKWSEGGHGIEVWLQGKVEFSSDFTDILSIEEGGHFKLRERHGLKYRSVKIEPDGRGGLAYSHYVAGFPSDWDDEARAWFTGLLPEAVDKTGIGAEQRARDLMAAQGLDGVLAKVEQLDSDNIKRIYYNVALKQGQPGVEDVARIARHLSREVDSNHYKYALLELILDDHDGAELAPDAIIEATATLDSDHYRSELLRALAALAVPTEAFYAAVAEMDSDHYKTVVLTELDEPRTSPALFDVVAGIDSDHYKSQVLMSLEDLETSAGFFETVATIGSDHYKAQVLTSLDVLEPTPALFEAIDEMDSDQYRQQVLTHLVDRGNLDTADLALAIDSAAEMDSDHYRNQFLGSMARDRAADTEVRNAFFAAVDRFDSDHYRHLLLDAVLAGRPDEQATYDAILTTTTGLGSDHYKSLILMKAAAQMPAEDTTVGLFLETADDIDSDHYLTQVLAELLKRDDLSEPALKEILATVKNKVAGQHYRGQLVEQIADRLIE